MKEEEELLVSQKLQEYIEEHILEPITLKQLAEAVNYSPWYIAKIFKKSTGKAPYDYIKTRRLTRAALDLRDGQKKVIDVALDFVFDSQEGFTRAFSKEFGITPGRYRRESPAIRLFLPERCFDVFQQLQRIRQKSWARAVKESRQYNNYRTIADSEVEESGESAEKRTDMNTKTVFCQIIERPERKCIIKRGINAEEYFDYCNEAGCDVWEILCSVKEALYEPIGMWLPRKLIPKGTSRYVQGVEVPLDYDKPLPEGYEVITLEPCLMMVFQGEPFDDEDFGDAIEEVWDHIDKFKPEIYGYAWDIEAAPRFQLEPQGYRGYIEARPVKKL